MENIDEVVGFLKENHPFYVATVDGDGARVRPFGFVMNFEGKLIFACNDQMKVYKQLQAHPKFEISTTNKSYEWVRVSGKASFITNRETKEKIAGLEPNIRNLSKEIDGLIIFAAEEAEATFYSFSGAPRILKL